MVLLRSLLEDTDLMTYFAHYPVDTPAWIERLSREPVWSDKVYRQGIQEFSNSRIWNGLRDKGVEPLGQRDYSILSAAVHSLPMGNSLLWRNSVWRSGPNVSRPCTELRLCCHPISRPRASRNLPAAN